MPGFEQAIKKLIVGHFDNRGEGAACMFSPTDPKRGLSGAEGRVARAEEKLVLGLEQMITKSKIGCFVYRGEGAAPTFGAGFADRPKALSGSRTNAFSRPSQLVTRH